MIKTIFLVFFMVSVLAFSDSPKFFGVFLPQTGHPQSMQVILFHALEELYQSDPDVYGKFISFISEQEEALGKWVVTLNDGEQSIVCVMQQVFKGGRRIHVYDVVFHLSGTIYREVEGSCFQSVLFEALQRFYNKNSECLGNVLRVEEENTMILEDRSGTLRIFKAPTGRYKWHFIQREALLRDHITAAISKTSGGRRTFEDTAKIMETIEKLNQILAQDDQRRKTAIEKGATLKIVESGLAREEIRGLCNRMAQDFSKSLKEGLLRGDRVEKFVEFTIKRRCSAQLCQYMLGDYFSTSSLEYILRTEDGITTLRLAELFERQLMPWAMKNVKK